MPAAKLRKWIGHYGCAGRIIRVRQRRPRLDQSGEIYHRTKPPVTAQVRCPGCGFRHLVSISWREAKPGELGKAEVAVG